MNTYASHALAMVIGGAIVAGGCLYHSLQPSLPSIIAQPSKEITKYITVTKPCPGINVYPDKVEKTLGLPESVRKSPTADVVASANIPSDDRSHTVTAVYDSKTMSVNLFDRRNSLPWFTIERRYSMGLWYGADSVGKSPTWQIRGDMELARIKSLSLGISGSLNTNGHSFVGVGGQVRF